MSDIERASNDLETLAKVTRELVTSRDPRALLSRLNQLLAGRVEFTRAAILLFDATGKTAQVVAATDRGDEEENLDLDLKKYPELQRLIETRNTVLIEDVASDPSLIAVQKEMIQAGGGAALILPLLFEGRLKGCIFLRRPAGGPPPSAAALQFGEIIAGTCATALHLFETLEKAHRQQAQAQRARLLAESKLEDSARFEEFFDYAAEGMAVLDLEGRILSANLEGQRLLGTKLAGEPPRLLDLAVANERGRIERLVRGFGAQVFPRDFHLNLARARGEEAILSLSCGALGGNAEGVILSFREITAELRLQRELTATKDFLENLITSSADAIVATELTGKVILYNRAAERLFERKASEVLGQLPMDDLQPEGLYRKQVEDLLDLGSGEEANVQHSEVLNAKGERIPVRLSGSLLQEGGLPVALVFIFQDLRAEIQLQEDLARRNSERDELEGALLMASTAAHELNQPLTTIVGFSEMALHQLEAEHRARKALQRVYDASERLAERVRDLGKLKRIVTRSYGDGAQIVDLEASTRTSLPHNKMGGGFDQSAQITDRFPTLTGEDS